MGTSMSSEHSLNNPLEPVAKVQLKKPDGGESVGPTGVAVSADEEIAVADIINSRVLLYSKEGEFIREFGQQGSGNGKLNQPFGVAFTPDGELAVTDELNHKVKLFASKTGEFLRYFGKEGTGNGEFKIPTGVSVDSEGRIIVCDFCNDRVQVFDRTNRFLFKFGDTGDEKLSLPYCCVFHNDRFFVTDSNNHCIKVFDKKGEYKYKFGRRGTEDGEFEQPCGLCAESDDKLIVCYRGNKGSNCVQTFTLDGQFVGKSVEPIPGNYQAAKCRDGTVVVTGFDEGCLCILK